MPESKDVLVEPAHSHTPIIQFFKLPCCKVQTVQPLTACDQGHGSKSSGEGTIYLALLVAQPKTGWPPAAPLLPLSVTAEMSPFYEL